MLRIEPFAKYIARADFGATQLSHSSIAILVKFENLESLNLSNTRLSGLTLGELSRLKKLETLNLYGTKRDVACLSELAKLTQLKKIHLFQTAVHEEPHLGKLKQLLPNCELN